MQIPDIYGTAARAQGINIFGGYNHTNSADINEFYEMQNMSSREYPMLATRRGRENMSDEFQGAYYMAGCNTFGDRSRKIKKAFAAVFDGEDGEGAVVRFIGAGEDGDAAKNSYVLGGDAADVRLVVQAGYIYAFPMGVRIGALTSSGEGLLSNTTSVRINSDYPSVEAPYTAVFEMLPCDAEGNTDGDAPKNYIFLKFTSNKPDSIEYHRFIGERNGKRQTDAGGNYIVDPFEGFNVQDAVEIKGISREYDKTYTVYAANSAGLILNGFIDGSIVRGISASNTVTLRRRVPEMDFVIECNNRLWGCRYGVSESGGSVINEIYASALGDPFNWYRYDGTADDCWTAEVGVDGEFTGAAVYGGYPVFFKENAIIRIWGSMPSNFQTAVYNYRGVKSGSSESLVICDEVLYWHSIDGVVAYTGSVPEKIDAALGDICYRNAAAGSVRGRVYISMEDSAGEWHLFVYDTRRGLWHREDSTHVRQFLRDGADLYAITDGGNVMKVSTVDLSEGTEDFEWYAVSGNTGYGEVGEKRLKKVKLRAEIPIGSELDVSVSYDGGEPEKCRSTEGNGEGVQNIAFIPKRCDRFRICLSGRGVCRIISIYFETEDT